MPDSKGLRVHSSTTRLHQPVTQRVGHQTIIGRWVISSNLPDLDIQGPELRRGLNYLEFHLQLVKSQEHLHQIQLQPTMGGGKEQGLYSGPPAVDKGPRLWPVDSLSVETAHSCALGSMWKLIDGEVPMGKDLLRETNLRYLGYANEIGEAFKRFLPPSLYKFSYVVAAGYVLADSVDKGMRAFHTWRAEQQAKDDPLSADYNKEPASTMPIITAVADTLVWQTFASVAVPGPRDKPCSLGV